MITPVLTEPTLDGQVERLLDELPERFALAGLSLGAVVAMALIRTAPERVERLCLLSVNPRRADPGSARRRGRPSGDDLAPARRPGSCSADLLPVLLSAGAPADVVEQTLMMADEVGEIALLDAQLQLQASRIDERPGLADVRCPTLVIAARDDRLCPVERHREIAALVPGAELVILERTAHLSPLERPAEITAALQLWRTSPTAP